MEEQGITQIYALPLFIASSSMFDIPTILGLYYNKKIVAKLKEEGAKIVGTKAKITIGPTLDYQSVLKDIMLERVKELSQDPKNEALVVLAHGDEQFSMFWNRLIHQTVNYILGQTGIEFAQKAYVEMGQSFAFNAIPVIKKAASKKNRVIVVGMYLSSGVKICLIKQVLSLEENLCKVT